VHFFSTSFMPHLGQSPGWSFTSSGCMGQVYCGAFWLVVDGLSLEQPLNPAVTTAKTVESNITLNQRFIFILFCDSKASLLDETGARLHETSYSLSFASTSNWLSTDSPINCRRKTPDHRFCGLTMLSAKYLRS